MDQQTHFADPSSLQMALMTGLVYEPLPEWDPEEGGWVVLARPRQGGSLWVLARQGSPVAFPDLAGAREEAAALGNQDAIYTIGRR